MYTNLAFNDFIATPFAHAPFISLENVCYFLTLFCPTRSRSISNELVYNYCITYAQSPIFLECPAMIDFKGFV